MKATVIIPAYNAGKTIEKCLASLREQSFKDFETIVVDDGSKDKTPEIAKSFRGVNLLQQENAGPAKARNKGAAKARGKILVFLDSDCVPEKNWLREMLAPFSDKTIAGVQGKYLNSQRELIARFTHLEIEQRYEKMAKSEFIDFIGSYSAAYRKSVFNEMNGFDTGFPMASGEDTDLSFRISEAGHKMKFNQNARVYHFHPISFTKYLKVKFFRAFWRTKIYRKHAGKMLKDSYTSQLIKIQTLLFYIITFAALLSPFVPQAAFTAPIAGILLVAATLPFAIWALPKDRLVAIVSPIIIILRTIMFGLGLAFGTINQLVGFK